MFLHFGYNCPIELLTGGQLNAASIPVLASHIEVRAVTTANPGPPQLELLSAGLTDIPFMLFLDEPPVITAVRDTPAPRSLALRPPFPNPFNPATTLTFDLPVGGEVTLEIFTVRGERVAVLQRGWMAAGSHTRRWSGLDQRGAPVASGVYFATLRTPAGTRQAKLNLLK
jgi:hypothetical protein